MINIADVDSFRRYLREKGIITATRATFKRLTGGVSCEVMRVDTPEQALVFKQALPKLRVQEDWFSDVTRIVIEKDCLAYYHQVAPACVPRLVFYDPDNYLYGMEAAPPDAVMWKKQLLAGMIDFHVGREVAEVLAKVHNAAAHDEQARRLFANQKFFDQLRIDPYFRFMAQRHPALADFIAQESERLLSNKITLVHGDYSPKNILVWRDRLFILDYEVAHIGDPSFDLAFLTNHFLLKAVKNKQWAPAYLNLMTDVANTYLGAVNFMDRRELEHTTVKTLAMLFLARVDGKSPAEYITAEGDKEIIRRLSYRIIQDGLRQYQDVAALVRHELAH